MPGPIRIPYVSAVATPDLEVAAGAPRRAAPEHVAGGVEVRERAADVQVLRVDRVDQRVRHAEPRVHLRGPLLVAQLLVELERPSEPRDLAGEVAGDRHDLGRERRSSRARPAGSADARSISASAPFQWIAASSQAKWRRACSPARRENWMPLAGSPAAPASRRCTASAATCDSRSGAGAVSIARAACACMRCRRGPLSPS